MLESANRTESFSVRTQQNMRWTTSEESRRSRCKKRHVSVTAMLPGSFSHDWHNTPPNVGNGGVHAGYHRPRESPG